MMNIEERLFAMQDIRYREFHKGLVPGMPEDYIIGVRMPDLRRLAKEIEAEPLLSTLPHRYYEENQLHAILLSGMKDFDQCLKQVERFLPYVNNWATCDGLRPRCFAKHTDDLQKYILRWLEDKHEYTVRFGIGILEAFYLDKAFKKEQLKWVANIRREEYYIKMMQAWYFATALAKQWDATFPIMSTLPDWVRRKTIQKACESYRVSDKNKSTLRTIL
ncbi:MAG: DNA alkylation repair protein [Bacteroidales bacterium]|nr:DNA alkylation repair protein [Bacteroidales bacterium]